MLNYADPGETPESSPSCPFVRSGAMSESLHKIIQNRLAGRDLPITLVLPDGGRVPLSPRAEVEVMARSWAGLKALARPAMA